MATRPLAGRAMDQRSYVRAYMPEHSHLMAAVKEKAGAAIHQAILSSVLEPGSLRLQARLAATPDNQQEPSCATLCED